LEAVDVRRAALTVESRFRIIHQRNLQIESRLGEGGAERRITALPAAAQFVMEVGVRLPLPRAGHERRFRRLETKRRRRVATRRSALLAINVVPEVVLALVSDNPIETVLVVHVEIDAGSKRLAVLVGRTRESETRGIQLVAKR